MNDDVEKSRFLVKLGKLKSYLGLFPQIVLGILSLNPLQLHGFRVYRENVHKHCLSGLLGNAMSRQGSICVYSYFANEMCLVDDTAETVVHAF